jgi:hypothetical protein
MVVPSILKSGKLGFTLAKNPLIAALCRIHHKAHC